MSGTVQELQEQLAAKDREIFEQAKLVVQLRHALEAMTARLEHEEAEHERTRDRWRVVSASHGLAIERLEGAKSLLESLRRRLRDARVQITALEEKRSDTAAVFSRPVADLLTEKARELGVEHLLRPPLASPGQMERCLAIPKEDCLSRKCPECPAYPVPPAPAAKESEHAA